ncbi:MAG: hypothetical protein M1286_01790 [Candidatus Marsarchaeota archaeon]|nr:hypothetical protein [Candidatus Marsarchaeota archaeon]
MPQTEQITEDGNVKSPSRSKWRALVSRIRGSEMDLISTNFRDSFPNEVQDLLPLVRESEGEGTSGLSYLSLS